MLITKTPYRISFFGGGTDYHTWYQEYGGSVLSTTINYYCNLLCLHKPPFFDKKHRIVWREIEECGDPSEIKHPAVSAIMEYMNIERGIEMHYQGDLPARSGLGSSSTFTVGFLNAMYALRGEMSTKEQLAAEAVHIEREVLKENVGVQDQIAAAYGGLNRINIKQDASFEVHPLTISSVRRHELKSHLMLFFTGISRNATDIAGDKIKKIPTKKASLHEMYKMVGQANDILMSEQDICDFGKLLHESWMLKRDISEKISNDLIDEIYQKAMQAGAEGGKLLGAGGGGFILFFVKPENQPKVLEALNDFMWVPFDFENKGSHVAYYSPSSFTRESMMRRDYAHLDAAGEYFKSEEAQNTERPIKLNIVD